MKEIESINNTNGISPDEYWWQRANVPMIYAFTTKDVPGAIKVGYTEVGVLKRIEQWEDYYDDIKLVGCWSSKAFDEAGQYVFFKDIPVHDRIEGRGYLRLTPEAFKNNELKTIHVSREFFNKVSSSTNQELSSEVLEAILEEMKHELENGMATFRTYKLNQDGTVNGEKSDMVISKINEYSPTELQEDAIEKGYKAIIERGVIHVLMAAVPRFGKTFTIYKIIKKCEFKRILVCSAKVDVKTSWWNDISHKDFIDDFVFIEYMEDGIGISEKHSDGHIHKTQYFYKQEDRIIDKKVAEGKTVIVFASLQDLAQSNDEIKPKHKVLGLYETNFDMIVVDETHFGSHGPQQGKSIGLNEDRDWDEQDREDHNQYLRKIKDSNMLKKRVLLQCSGTPYYILKSGEFADEYKDKEVICDVTYDDLLEAHKKWCEEHQDMHESDSPYYGIPKIHKIGMHLTKECEAIINNTGKSTKMSVLFEINQNTGKFVYENAIRKLIEHIYGDPKKSKVGFLDTNKIKDGEIFKHTIIVLPRRNACWRMRDLLKSMDIEREIICVVIGENNKLEDAAIDANTLNRKLEELERSGKRSIILTVSRFLTGLTLPLVDSMLFMNDTKSPQEYDQSMFRMCSRNIMDIEPSVDNSEDDDKKINRKANVFLIDFNIARMYEMVKQSIIAKARNEDKEEIERQIERSLDASPMSVYECQGDEIIEKMHEIKKEDFMNLYYNYNPDSSINQMAKGYIEHFEFTSVLENLDFMQTFKGGMFSKQNDELKDINNSGQDTLSVIPGSEETIINNQEKNLKSGKQATREKDNRKKELKKCFLTCIKYILYCNLVFDKPEYSFKRFMKTAKTIEIEKAKAFGLHPEFLDTLKEKLSNQDKVIIDMMLYRVLCQSNDSSIGDEVVRFNKAIEDLGKIGKNEFVTPKAIVEKMLGKIDEEHFHSAQRILLLNEKCGEFLLEIYKKYGVEVASKCRIIPSSKMTMYFIMKVVKSLGLDPHIILDIQVESDDKKPYDKFLKMIDNNENEILKCNDGKKFDICLMNPPYDRGLHIKFLEKINKISNKYVSIQPISFLQKLYLYGNREKSNGVCCDNIEVISLDKASKIFNIAIRNDIGIISKISDTDNLNFSGLFDKDDLDMISKCLSYVKNTDQLSAHLDNSSIENKYSLKFTDGAALYHHGRMVPTTFRVCAYNYNIACSREKTGHVKYLNVETSDKVRKNIWDFYNSVYMRWWIFKCCLAETSYKYVPYLEERRFNKPWEIKDYEDFFINEIKISKDQWKEYKSKAEKLPI